MKLIKCHIENFGKLSNSDYDFTAGLTGFCEHNGFGKTTLAAFIKAMFFGLPSVRINAKEFNDRKHFYPFSGGKFGGNITFETGGDTYRIERFFGKKSDTDDELTVYRNNKIFHGFGGDVGKAVFGVDKESFERTVFITSDAFDFSATNGMCAKLNCFVENSDGDTAFENVIGKLERARKDLKAGKGNNDLISRTNQAIFDIKSEIVNLESIAKNLDDSYIQKNGLEQKILHDEARLEEIKSTNLILERWEKYDAMSASETETENSLKEWQTAYPYGLPSESENLSLKNYARQLTLLGGAQTATVFDEEKQERLRELTEIFAEGVPDEQYLKSLRYDLDEIKSIGVQTSSLTEADNGQRFSNLQQKFSGKIPSEKQLAELETKIDKYRNLDNRRKAQASIAVPTNAPKKNNTLFIVLLVLFAAVAAAGIALVFVNLFVGAALLAAGAIAAVIDAVLWKVKGSASPQGAVIIDQAAVDAQAELQQIESAVREFLVTYGYYSQNGVVFDFEMLKKDLTEYLQYQEEALQKQDKINDLKTRKRELTVKVYGIFDQYGVACDDLQSAYVALCNLISEFRGLQADSAKAEKGAVDTQQQIDGLYTSIKTIFDKYKIKLSDNVFEQIEEIAKASEETSRLNVELKKIKSEMSEYAAKYNLTYRPTADIVDFTQLSEQIKADRNLLAILDGQISSDEAMIENLDDKYGELEVLEEKLKDYKRRHYVLSETEKMIKKADQNLKDRYVAPVKNIFLKYADVIEETLGERITIDQDFNIMFEHSGEIHSEKHFSSGLRSICALCMRLAFVDNMYGKDKPFIIMDDPFVFLDEKHMQNTTRVIKELAKDNQIIYFCCHDSRNISA
ncbi:MAG: AAA family ATPase [Clostridia bacterium]|nr:AAA family ATPase [Clostridia bacterium]